MLFTEHTLTANCQFQKKTINRFPAAYFIGGTFFSIIDHAGAIKFSGNKNVQQTRIAKRLTTCNQFAELT